MMPFPFSALKNTKILWQCESIIFTVVFINWALPCLSPRSAGIQLYLCFLLGIFLKDSFNLLLPKNHSAFQSYCVSLSLFYI